MLTERPTCCSAAAVQQDMQQSFINCHKGRLQLLLSTVTSVALVVQQQLVSLSKVAGHAYVPHEFVHRNIVIS